jgi:pilus assembly protein CpaE
MAQPATAKMVFDDEDEREPFAAYVADDASHAAAMLFAERRGWSSGSIRRGSLPSALRLLGVAPPPRLMIVDVDGLPLDEVDSGLTELARLGSSVLALGSVNDVGYFRRIIRTGARDYLVKPVDADLLGEVFVRFEQAGEDGQLGGRVVGLIGARGGVGVTTLAINTAWIMADKLSRRTALVDMDIYAGTIALTLDMEPTRGLREAIDDPERVDEVFLQNAMTKFGKSLHVLGTEEALNDTVRMSDEKLLMLVDAMRSNFDMTVLDLPRHFVIREPALFSKLDDIVIVTELTLQGLRDSNRLLRLFAARNHDAKIHVVANNVATKPDVAVAEFEAGMEAKLRCCFASDCKAMSQASFRGQPLAGADAKHKLVQSLYGLCKELAGVPEDTKAGKGLSLFGWPKVKKA